MIVINLHEDDLLLGQLLTYGWILLVKFGEFRNFKRPSISNYWHNIG